MTTLMQSRTWFEGPTPVIAVVVSTYRRPQLLSGLVAALESQDLSADQFEVVVVDNGSNDGTWDKLVQVVSDVSLRMVALRFDDNRGPGGGRNRGSRLVRAQLLAMTDDDCLPTAGWLRGLLEAFASGADVVQGRVCADPEGLAGMGPWDHTVWITPPTPFFETCNVAYRTTAFERVEGFDEADPLTSRHAGGRAFGEDALLAWRVLATGAQPASAPDAVVYHRCMPSTYSRYLGYQREHRGFPGLARSSPLVNRWLWHRGFLTRQSAEVDLALASVVMCVATRRGWPLLGMWPWVRRLWNAALSRTRGDRNAAAVVMAGLALGDVVGFISLVEGSVRHRRLVL